MLIRDSYEYVMANFNPRSSCEERLGRISSTQSRFYFNPRSSCEERLGTNNALGYNPFQSTLLMRGATTQC